MQRSETANDTTICLDCRTVLQDGERCDGGRHHRPVDLKLAAGREALLNEVWGPPGLRRQARRIATAGGSGAAVGMALEGGCEVGCAAVDCASGVSGVAELGGVLLVAGAFILIYLIGAWIVRAIQRRRQRLRPNGALRRPRLPAGGHHRGRVAVDASTVVGLSGAAGVAHALRLRTGRFLRSDLMLVDGRSAGFLVQLEDGRQVRVPAGRVRLQGPVKRERVVSRARADLRVDRLDPLGQQLQSAEELDPIPYDRAGELVLRPGDPVELWGRLEPVVDPRAAHGGYRQPAASLLEPVGPFVLGLAG